MNGAFEIGAVSLNSKQSALDTIANNVANINTPAFKRTDVQFAEIVTATPDAATEAERLALRDGSAGGGVRMAPRQMIAELGELRSTGSAMDVAIDGLGFIELMGPDGQSLLWRGGRLEVNRDGYLAAANGPALRALISIPDDVSNLMLSREGVVSAEGEEGEIIELGQLLLVKPDSMSSLEAVGAGVYRLGDDARLLDAEPGRDGVGSLQQGMIEGSNVEMTDAMVEMLILQRAYAASAQVVQTADQISSITNNLRR